uniref:ATP synthase F0 subunit 8 n=1 Tax=Plakobranchus cf. ocellatus HW-2015 TaxID=1962732 RepID=A0A343B774_9GAST|nr:ATP synthase F0 subunit 8 [Plakobranchus cf. ocellatus HW-2015]
MPQLSPAMGILVFLFTNISFIILMLSVRPSISVEPSKSSLNTAEKAFRSFS